MNNLKCYLLNSDISVLASGTNFTLFTELFISMKLLGPINDSLITVPDFTSVSSPNTVFSTETYESTIFSSKSKALSISQFSIIEECPTVELLTTVLGPISAFSPITVYSSIMEFS
jgi:hypothetical protein